MSDGDGNADQARFWRKFLRLTRGRVQVIRALEVIAEESEPPMRSVVDSMREQIDDGKSLAEAMSEHPDKFSLSVRELIRTAEKTGAWDDILQEIADGLADGTFD